MKQKRGILFGAIGLVVVMTGLDMWTKWAVVSQMKLGQSIEIIKNFFYLTYVQNTGAGFSIFTGYGKVFFGILTVAAMAAMIYFFWKSKDPGVQLTIALIFAGALGNFIDRMTLGYVVDFFHFYIFGWSFPVFNIADICISVGFILLLVHMALEEYKEMKHADTTDDRR
jgi:signal peptidase II